jgi:peptidoglycan/xylan/chitin deacetylase (PgdA/CDA1 family)
MIRIALSHDIDRTRKTYQFFTKPLRVLIKGRYKEFYLLFKTLFKKNNYWTFEDILNIETSYDVKSTFFFLNESIRFNILKPNSFILAKGRYNILDPKIVNLIKRLDKNGWEIGVHGSYNSFQNKTLLQKEKKVLEKILGHQVIGIRQHYLNLNKDTWDIQQSAGFLYDSSYGSTRSIGFINNKYLPFQPLGTEFTVFPQVIMDACFMANKNRWKELDKLLDICEKKNAILVINFHNHVFNENEFPNFRDAYIKLIAKGKERGAHFATLSDHLSNINSKKI